MSEQYIQKNVAFVVGVLYAAVNTEDEIELSRLALLMPLLMDDRIVSNLNDDSKQYGFETLTYIIHRNKKRSVYFCHLDKN